MAISIDINSLDTALTQTCHFVPCRIDFKGGAKVSDFFAKTIAPVVDSENNLTASFRGRPLNGCVLALPSGYTGLMLKEPHTPSTDDQDRTLFATHKFKAFTYWNLDKEPTPDDSLQKAFQWIELCAPLHQPVGTEVSLEDSSFSQAV